MFVVLLKIMLADASLVVLDVPSVEVCVAFQGIFNESIHSNHVMVMLSNMRWSM